MTKREIVLGAFENLRRQVKALNNAPILSGPEGEERAERLQKALGHLDDLQNMVQRGDAVFGYEPWHPMQNAPRNNGPAEMLLRIKDGGGRPVSPYEFVMSFYETGLSAELDLLLLLCAMRQFEADSEESVSVNISSQSLVNKEFIRTILDNLESDNHQKHGPDALILEIHESATRQRMSREVLGRFAKAGIGFAIDDVGLNMGDVFRLAEFDDIARYIKIDRKCVCSPMDKSETLPNVLSFIELTLPGAVIVAEGVQDTRHAYEIAREFKNIHYGQGLYMPARETFEREWSNLEARRKIIDGED